MKRREFIRDLEETGCKLYRHGKRHDIYINPTNGRKSPIPRHVKIKVSLYKLICKQLGIGE